MKKIKTDIKITQKYFIYRQSFNNDVVAMKAFINTAISETNQGYSNSKVPINMVLHCIRDSSVRDDKDSEKMLNAFEAAASNFITI